MAATPTIRPSTGPRRGPRVAVVHPGEVDPGQSNPAEIAQAKRIAVPLAVDLSRNGEASEISRYWSGYLDSDGITAVIRMGSTRAVGGSVCPALPVDYKHVATRRNCAEKTREWWRCRARAW